MAKHKCGRMARILLLDTSVTFIYTNEAYAIEYMGYFWFVNQLF